MDFIKNIIDKLSLGEKRRINLARFLVKPTKVLIADEITSSLDRLNSFNIELYLLKSNITFIHVSHNSNEKLKNLYDKVITLKDKSIQTNI